MRHYYACNPVKNKAFENFVITGVKDIGLRSESIDCGWGVFASGRTSALFQNLGTWPSLMEELKMGQTGLEMIGAQSFITKFGILSGPTYLRSLITDRASSTASEEIMYSSGTSMTGIGVYAKGDKSSVTRLKDSLNYQLRKINVP